VHIDLRIELNMAEYIPPPKTLFSVKIVNGQLVVENYDDSGDMVPEGIREHYHACLNNFRSALALANEKDYDKDVINQLLLSNDHLVLCLPNRRIKELELKIEELELSLAPLRHHQAAHQYMLGAEITETDEPSQQATDDAPGMNPILRISDLISLKFYGITLTSLSASTP